MSDEWVQEDTDNWVQEGENITRMLSTGYDYDTKEHTLVLSTFLINSHNSRQKIVERAKTKKEIQEKAKQWVKNEH